MTANKGERKDFSPNSSEDVDLTTFIRLGKAVSIPWKTVRLSFYVACLSVLEAVRLVSILFGFNYSYKFSEKEEWAWFDIPWKKLAGYRPYAGVEKRREKD